MRFLAEISLPLQHMEMKNPNEYYLIPIHHFTNNSFQFIQQQKAITVFIFHCL